MEMEETKEALNIEVSSKKDGTSTKKRGFWHINKEMLRFKVHFFLFVGGMSAILPFMSPLGITKLGLTASNLAAAYTLQKCLYIFIKPGIGYLADYFNRLKATIVGLTVLQALFCFFMINIQSADIPKNYISHSNASLNNYYKINLCTHSEELQNISFNEPLARDVLAKVLDCIKNSENNGSENIVFHCPNGNREFFHFNNISFLILQTMHYDSLMNCFSSINCTIPHNLHSVHILLVSEISDNSKKSFFICFPPKRITLFHENFTYSFMEEYCHEVVKFDSTDLEDLFLAKPFKRVNCMNYKSNISTRGYFVHDDLTAANFQTYQFWLFTLCLLAAGACIGSIYTISDTACYDSMQGVNYGSQRAWGSLSWGLIAPLAGFLNDYTEGYMASWCLMALLCTAQFLNMSKMNLVKPDFSKNILKDMRAVFSSFEFLAFEVGVLMHGMFSGTIWVYLPWFLITIGGNKLVIGLAYTTQCFLGEVPFMFLSNWMIKKFGHFNLVSLALIAYGIRFFSYSFLYNPWWVLPIESLHGLTFATFHSAMTSYGKMNSKPGTEATTQSILSSTHKSLGAGLGCVISGVCFDYYGGHTTFFYASFFCMAAALINVVFTILIAWRKKSLEVNTPVTATKGSFEKELETNVTEQQLFI